MGLAADGLIANPFYLNGVKEFSKKKKNGVTDTARSVPQQKKKKQWKSTYSYSGQDAKSLEELDI